MGRGVVKSAISQGSPTPVVVLEFLQFIRFSQNFELLIPASDPRCTLMQSAPVQRIQETISMPGIG